jgi:hypothetical protein
MNTRDKILYQQIHPAKLATDIFFAFGSLYFFWYHELVIALMLHVVPSIIVTILLVRFVSLERQRHSKFGHYVARTMTHTVEAVRFGGDIMMVVGAWFHQPVVIVAGVCIIIGAWFSGVLFGRTRI